MLKQKLVVLIFIAFLVYDVHLTQGKCLKGELSQWYFLGPKQVELEDRASQRNV